MAARKTGTCQDCGNAIYKGAIRCASCRVKAARIKQHPQLMYKPHLYADEIHIEYTSNNEALITAYQGKAKTQLKYFRDKLDTILERLQATITAYTFDPLVYDSKQSTDTITINRNTRIIYNAANE